MSFNPRSREGNDYYRFFIVSPIFVFQSTFPRGERRIHQETIVRAIKVSIHVPARGTTSLARRHEEAPESFNPRSREGNDTFIQWIVNTLFRFNPRSREGNDTSDMVAVIFPRIVSIHVPARGTTRYGDFNGNISERFNPRSREGNDYHPRTVSPYEGSFNPRSREGNDAGCV